MALLLITSRAHLGWIDYGIFGICLIATLGIGFLFQKGQQDTKQYLLGGRNMKSLVVSIAVLASVFSGVSYLGFPAEAYAYGMGYSLLAFSSFVTTPIINAVFMPFFYRVRLYSAYQYLEERFAFGLRTLIAIIFVCRTLLWMSIVVYAPALALEHATGFPLWVMILSMGIITTIYTTVGGMKAVIWSNVLQFVVLMGGLIAVVAVAVWNIPGGIDGVLSKAAEGGRLHFDFSWNLTTRVTVWGILIGGTIHNLVLLATDQVSIQRYMTSKNLKSARKAMWIKAYLWVPCAFFFYFAGLVLFSFYKDSGQDPLSLGLISSADQILPYFVVNEMPVGFAGLLIAGIVAASMSSMSSGLNSATTVSLIDLAEQYSKKQIGEKRKVQLAKILTVVFGIIVTLVAFVAGRFGSLIEAPVRIFGLLGGPLLGLFLLGMLSRRANAPGAISGWITGTIATIILAFATHISFLWYAISGMLVSFIVGLVISYMGPNPENSRIQGLTWTTRYETEKEPVD
jgi:sodium-coupled monocarboxylate transporter 8/12